jgi:hypothetical protein
MRTVLMMLALLAAVAGSDPAAAAAGKAGTVYCAADDAGIKLALDGWLQQDGPAKEDRIEGVLALKQSAMPQDARGMALTTKMITDITYSESGLRLALRASYPAPSRTQQQYAMDLTLDVAGAPELHNWHGQYRLVISRGPAGRTPPVADEPLTGALFCNIE